MNTKYWRGNRLYQLPDGRWVPSVTSILKLIPAPQLEVWKVARAAKAVAAYPEIAKGSDFDVYKRVNNATREASSTEADLGSWVHAVLEAKLKGDVPPETAKVHPIEAARWQGITDEAISIVKARGTGCTQLVEIEAYYESECPFAGRIDLAYVHNGAGIVTVIDWTTAKAIYLSKWAQMAAYGMMIGGSEFGLETIGVRLSLKEGVQLIDGVDPIGMVDLVQACATLWWSAYGELMGED